jgi:small multidrug resistance pump
MIYFLFIIYILLSAGGLILFKLGSKDLVVNIINGQINLIFNWYLVCGLISYVVSFILWLYIITQTKLSLSLPISVGLVNICVLIGASLFVGENVSMLQWLGVIIIIIGLIILNLEVLI